MKILYFVLLPICILSKASFSQIANSDFESWVNIGGWFENPDSWHTNNSQILVAHVVKDTDAYSGIYSARLTNYTPIVPFLHNAFSIAVHPAHLNFYVKTLINGNDSVWISVILQHAGNAVDSGRWSMQEDISNYSLISLLISNSVSIVDSLIIEIHGGSEYGTDLKIDHLEFDYDFSNITKTSNELLVTVVENPFQELLQINIPSSPYESFDFELYDITGKLQIVISKTESSKSLLSIDASTLSSGTYIGKIKKGNYFRILKLVKW